MLTENPEEIRDQNEKPFSEDDAKEMEAERGVLGQRGKKEGDTKTKHPPKTIPADHDGKPTDLLQKRGRSPTASLLDSASTVVPTVLS